MAGKIEELPPPALRQGYTDAFEHLVDELLRVRLLLQRLVIRKQERGELSGGGLSVARGEIACFFARPPGAGETEAAGPMAAPGGEQAAALSPALLDGLLGEVRQRIDERLAATGQLGRFRPPLLGLERRFALKPEEMDIVRVLLAPEIDPRFERAYCYCWNDFTRKRPTIGFVLELLADDLRGMEAYRDLLLASGTLRHCGLVLLPAESAGSQESFLARSVLLSPRIVDFLRGRDEPDESIRRYARHIVPELQLDRLVLPEAVRRAALEAAGAALDCWAGRAAVQDGQACPAAARKKAARALHLWGRPHAGKRSLVLAVAAATGRPVWQVDLGTLFAELEQREDQLWAVLREARLSDAVTLLDASADVPADGVPWRTAALLAEAIRAIPGPVFVCAPHRLGWLLHACPALREQPLPMPTADEREKVLVQTLSRLGPCEADLDLPDLASRFGLTGGALVRAAHLAREMADERADEGELRRADLLAACQKELSHRLASLAEQLSSTFGWDDVVLPEATLSRLKELLAYARNRRFILESWGFRHILPYGGGLTVLFTGPPGTGKTMVA
ncbi:MAG: hypothetical protein FJ125_02915, partial [Deltaproteobacteria bacterium]|nr:hypothetical protein [Deltaproteobacteria bacterium]